MSREREQKVIASKSAASVAANSTITIAEKKTTRCSKLRRRLGQILGHAKNNYKPTEILQKAIRATETPIKKDPIPLRENLSIKGEASIFHSREPRGQKERKIAAMISRAIRKRGKDTSAQSNFTPIKDIIGGREVRAVATRFKPSSVVPITAAGTLDIGTTPRAPDPGKAHKMIVIRERGTAFAAAI
jgi:hypothetical protein